MHKLLPCVVVAILLIDMNQCLDSWSLTGRSKKRHINIKFHSDDTNSFYATTRILIISRNEISQTLFAQTASREVLLPGRGGSTCERWRVKSSQSPQETHPGSFSLDDAVVRSWTSVSSEIKSKDQLPDVSAVCSRTRTVTSGPAVFMFQLKSVSLLLSISQESTLRCPSIPECSNSLTAVCPHYPADFLWKHHTHLHHICCVFTCDHTDLSSLHGRTHSCWLELVSTAGRSNAFALKGQFTQN